MAIDNINVLGKIFTDARNRLFDVIINTGGAGTKTYANTILKAMEREIAQLQAATGGFVNTEIPEQYRKGLEDTYEYFQRNGLLMRQPEYWAVLHRDAIYDLAREMQHNIGSALIGTGRQVQRYVDVARADALRQAGLEQTAIKMASGGTVKDMRDAMIRQMQEQGFMTVQYGEGSKSRQVPIDTYAQMVARTTTKEAGNTARENQLTENSYDLMQMTKHYPTCEKCAPLQGRVYSISGKDKRFPPISVAQPRGYKITHPHCRHVFLPWLEEFRTEDEIKQAIKRSNAPFEDTRNAAEIALYDKQQAQNRQYRQEQHQYERYKARLGDGAPKTLAAFRRIKRADGSSWATLQEKYRVANPNLESPKSHFINVMHNNGVAHTDYADALKKRFDAGTPEAKKAFEKFVPPGSVIDGKSSATPGYNLTDDRIRMNFSKDARNAAGAGVTYFHEHGHLIDYAAGGPVSSDKNFVNALRNDYRSFIMGERKSNPGLRAKDLYDKIAVDLRQRNTANAYKYNAVSDIVEGLNRESRDRYRITVGRGHDPFYWYDDFTKIEKEAFAHLFESQFDPARLKAFREYFPGSTAEFERLLKGLV